jgi:hypothetical protein
MTRLTQSAIKPSAERYFTFKCVRFFRAQRGKTAHKTIDKYHAAAGEKHIFEMQKNAAA